MKMIKKIYNEPQSAIVLAVVLLVVLGVLP